MALGDKPEWPIRWGADTSMWRCLTPIEYAARWLVYWMVGDKLAWAYRESALFRIAGLGLAAAIVIWLTTIDYTTVFEFFRKGGETKTSNSEIVRNVGLLALGIVGLCFGIWRAWTAHRQTVVSEEGLVTDRFTKAIEQLGNEQLPVRIGAIYALWRVAEDSPDRDAKPIWDTLCAFVRQPPHPEEQTDPAVSEDPETPSPTKKRTREDIQIILNLLGGAEAAETRGTYTLDFAAANLEEVNLEKANLEKVKLEGANLRSADLRSADLRSANLWWADLEGASLRGANLRSANLWWADLQGAGLGGAALGRANLMNANLKGADLSQEQLDSACGVPGPRSLPDGLVWKETIGGKDRACFER